MCDTVFDSVVPGEEWTANVYSVASIADGGPLPHEMGGVNALIYEEATWLAQQRYNPPVNLKTLNNPLNLRASLQNAIWSLFTTGFALTADEQTLLTDALNAVNTNAVNYTNAVIYTWSGTPATFNGSRSTTSPPSGVSGRLQRSRAGAVYVRGQ